ncbi:MAG: hypothetical protein WDN72_00060 [Alphaproteobacteria bacterium]
MDSPIAEARSRALRPSAPTFEGSAPARGEQARGVVGTVAHGDDEQRVAPPRCAG